MSSAGTGWTGGLNANGTPCLKLSAVGLIHGPSLFNATDSVVITTAFPHKNAPEIRLDGIIL